MLSLNTKLDFLKDTDENIYKKVLEIQKLVNKNYNSDKHQALCMYCSISRLIDCFLKDCDACKCIEDLNSIEKTLQGQTVWVTTFDKDVLEELDDIARLWTSYKGKECLLHESYARSPYVEYLYEFPMLDLTNTGNKTVEEITQRLYSLEMKEHIIKTEVTEKDTILEEAYTISPNPFRQTSLLRYLDKVGKGYLEFIVFDDEKPEDVERQTECNTKLGKALQDIMLSRVRFIQKYTSKVVECLNLTKHAFFMHGSIGICTLSHNHPTPKERKDIYTTLQSYINDTKISIMFKDGVIPDAPSAHNGKYDIDFKYIKNFINNI